MPVIDARKSEVFWAMYRPVPGGVQQVSPPTVGPVDDLVGDLLARSQDVLCVGDGAERYREEIYEGYRCEISGPTYPSVGMLVLLAHSRALREEWVRPDEMHQAFNFAYLETPWQSDPLRRVIDDSIAAFAAVGAPSTWVLSNHDVVRHATRLSVTEANPQGHGLGPR